MSPDEYYFIFSFNLIFLGERNIPIPFVSASFHKNPGWVLHKAPSAASRLSTYAKIDSTTGISTP